MLRIFSLLLALTPGLLPALTPGLLSAQISQDLRLDNSSYPYGAAAEVCLDFTNQTSEAIVHSYQDCHYLIDIDGETYSFNQFQIGSCRMDCSLTIQEFNIPPGETRSICSTFVMEDQNLCSIRSPSLPDVNFSVTDRHNFSAFGSDVEVLMSGLPVELGDFTVLPTESGQLLEWSTLSELNNQGFEVQRSEGSDFETIAFVNGHGNSVETQSYHFIDLGDSSVQVSYRLKQLDYDGGFNYSKIVETAPLRMKGIDLGQAFPNPFSDQASFSLSVDEAQDLSVILFDKLGRKVRHVWSGRMKSGENRLFKLEKGDLSAGQYFYSVQGENNQKMKSILIL